MSDAAVRIKAQAIFLKNSGYNAKQIAYRMQLTEDLVKKILVSERLKHENKRRGN